jgi:hypothetical protein
VKKLPFPILFIMGLTLLPEIRFTRHHSNLSFRLLIQHANRRAIACAEATRSVTHLVLDLQDEGDFLGFDSRAFAALRYNTSATNRSITNRRIFKSRCPPCCCALARRTSFSHTRVSEGALLS